MNNRWFYFKLGLPHFIKMEKGFMLSFWGNFIHMGIGRYR